MGVGSWAQPSASALCWNLKVAVSLRSCMCLSCVQASEEETARERTPRSTVQASRRTAMPTAWTQPPETSWKFFLLPSLQPRTGALAGCCSSFRDRPTQRDTENLSRWDVGVAAPGRPAHGGPRLFRDSWWAWSTPCLCREGVSPLDTEAHVRKRPL